MPQFLTTAGTVHALENIIIKAQRTLVLITPYLQLSRILTERLAEASYRGVRITLVYGKTELRPAEQKQLQQACPKLELLYLHNLHAKCYHNETTLLVTSMNLYEFSEKNNREMGVLLTLQGDAECFTEAQTEARSIIAAAQKIVQNKAPQPDIRKSLSLSLSPEVESAQKHLVQAVNQLLNAHKWEGISNSPVFALDPTIWKRFPTHPGEVKAANMPRPGIHFKFDGSLHFNFDLSIDYDHFCQAHRETLTRQLAAYRLYWNRNALQVYVAGGYKAATTQAEAAHYVQAVDSVVRAMVQGWGR